MGEVERNSKGRGAHVHCPLRLFGEVWGCLGVREWTLRGQAKKGMVKFQILTIRRDDEPEAGAEFWR